MFTDISFARIHVDRSGEVEITGMGYRGNKIDIVISNSNPLSFIDVNNDGFVFMMKNRNATYSVKFEDMDTSYGACPTRKLYYNGSGDKQKALIYFIHDITAEVLHWNYMRNFMHMEEALEVDYLRSRYSNCKEYIDKLDFQEIINHVLRRTSSAGVSI